MPLERYRLHNDGPLLFGGFAFDPLHSNTQLWEGFRNGLLILPRLLFNSNGNYAALTINIIIHAHDDIERCTDEIIGCLKRLSVLVGHLSTYLQQETSGSQAHLVVQDLVPADQWIRQVANTIQKIQHGTYQKVVLARGVQVANETESIDIRGYASPITRKLPRSLHLCNTAPGSLFCGSYP